MKKKKERLDANMHYALTSSLKTRAENYSYSKGLDLSVVNRIALIEYLDRNEEKK